MQRKVHVFLLHRLYEESHGGYHHHGVGCFYRNHHLEVVFRHKHPQKFHRALHHPCRGVAIATHDAVAQRAVVHADAHCGAVLAADVDKRAQRVADALYLGGIFLVGVFKFLEGARRVNEIARVDAHFVGYCRGGKRGGGIEMDVGYKRRGVAVGAHQGAYFPYCVSLFHPLGRESHIRCSGVGNPFGLRSARFDVVGRCRGHRLYSYRVLSAERYSAHIHAPGVAAVIVVVAFHFGYIRLN